jgi:N,N'-diacetyllegionaminate synthase
MGKAGVSAVKIGNRDLTRSTFIVAEIGANHEGNFAAAKELLLAAAGTGVDAVKFQTYQAGKIVARTEKERYAHFERLALRNEEFAELAELAKKRDLIFLSTPFDIEAIDFLDRLVPAFKIASGDITYLSLIEHAARKGKPIILSTGMANMAEIRQALKAVKRGNSQLIEKSQVVLLHCVSSYPANIEEANLRAVPFLKEKFHLPVGYSDHTLGITACLTAVALGACLLEKHFTLDKNRRGFRDHQLSADVKEMTDLVAKVRQLEKSLGEYKKEPTAPEMANRASMRRSLAAREDIPPGTVLTADMLTALRPEAGIPVNRLPEVTGRICRRHISRGDILFPEDVARL